LCIIRGSAKNKLGEDPDFDLVQPIYP